MSRNLFQLSLSSLPVDFDVRELSFQNVISNILQPAGVKMGGFPDELFTNLTTEEREEMMCNICYLIANDCRRCDNQHVFCHSCIVAWTMTFGDNAHRCPFCRCEQLEYNVDEQLQKRINTKYVRCLEEGCSFTSTLADYLQHCHGNARYSNVNIDLDRLRPRLRLDRERSLLSDETNSFPFSLRAQLIQSQSMIRQMMTLMRIEMQLRQQALIGLQRAQDARAAQADLLTDDAVGLSEQLHEISSLLSTLHTPAPTTHTRRWSGHRCITGRAPRRRLDANSASGGGPLRYNRSTFNTSQRPLLGSHTRSILFDSYGSDIEEAESARMPLPNMSSLLHMTSESPVENDEDEDDDDDDGDDDNDGNDSDAISAAFRQNAAAVSTAVCLADGDDDEMLWQELTRGDLGDYSDLDLDFSTLNLSGDTNESPDDLENLFSPDIAFQSPSRTPSRTRAGLHSDLSLWSETVSPVHTVTELNGSRRLPDILLRESSSTDNAVAAGVAEVYPAAARSATSCRIPNISNSQLSSTASSSRQVPDQCPESASAGKIPSRNDDQQRDDVALHLLVRRTPAAVAPINSSSNSSQNRVQWRGGSASRPVRPPSYLTDAARQRIAISGLAPANNSSTSELRTLRPLAPPRCLQSAAESSIADCPTPALPPSPLRTPLASGRASRAASVESASSGTWPRRLARPQRQNKL